MLTGNLTIGCYQIFKQLLLGHDWPNRFKYFFWFVSVNENVHFPRPRIVAVNFSRTSKRFSQFLFELNHFVVIGD